MSNKKQEPLVSDEDINDPKLVIPLGAKMIRDIYEASRAKDAELIQQMVDGFIGVYWMGQEASKKLITELLATAAAAGYKPTDR